MTFRRESLLWTELNFNSARWSHEFLAKHTHFALIHTTSSCSFPFSLFHCFHNPDLHTLLLGPSSFIHNCVHYKTQKRMDGCWAKKAALTLVCTFLLALKWAESCSLLYVKEQTFLFVPLIGDWWQCWAVISFLLGGESNLMIINLGRERERECFDFSGGISRQEKIFWTREIVLKPKGAKRARPFLPASSSVFRRFDFKNGRYDDDNKSWSCRGGGISIFPQDDPHHRPAPFRLGAVLQCEAGSKWLPKHGRGLLMRGLSGDGAFQQVRVDLLL